MKTFLSKTSAILFLLTVCINITDAQTIYTYAGTGIAGFSGDGGNVLNAQINNATGIAIDPTGNVYIADYLNQRIRKVNTTGIISTFAGTGSQGFSGDGGVATLADLSDPIGISVDATGNVYIVDWGNNRIRKVNTFGIISTVAGNGTGGFNGDGGLAINATLYDPKGVTVDAAGNLYIADASNNRIRKVNTSGIISTFAGSGIAGFSGDGSSATSAQLNRPSNITFDATGNAFIVDYGNNRIRKVSSAGIISTIAGTNIAGYGGDGGSATSAYLQDPTEVVVDGMGNLFVADWSNSRIRKINSSGIISTFAGGGTGGDGGPASSSQLIYPYGIKIDGAGNLYIAEAGNHKIRIVCSSSCQSNINSLIEKADEILIFPNPTNGSFKLQIENKLESGKIILYNSIGQKVYDQSVIQGENNINANGLAAGLYHYTILENKQVVSNGKLVIE